MNDKPSNDKRQPLLKRVASGLDSFAAGIGVAALLAGVTAYLVRRKQKSPTRQAVIETQPQPAPTSPSRKPIASIVNISWVCIVVWIIALIFGVLALLAVITRRTDAWWWAALLSGALSAYFAITGVGLWRLKQWGFVFLIIGLAGLGVFSLVLDLRDGDVAELVWDLFMWGVMVYGLAELWKITKHGPRPAPPSPPRKSGDSAMQRISMLWRFVFVVLVPLFVMITSVTDVWWVILLSSALIMYFVVTGAGVWRLQKWGFVLLAVGLTGLVVFSFVSDARDSDVVGFVWRVSILAILLPCLPVLWQVARARFR